MVCKRCKMEYKPEHDDEIRESCGGTGVEGYLLEPCHDCFGTGIIEFDYTFCPSCERIMANILVK